MFALIANEPGRHGYSVVGTFDTVAAAEEWRDKNKLNGMVKPLIAPDDWQANDGSSDDTAKEFEG